MNFYVQEEIVSPWHFQILSVKLLKKEVELTKITSFDGAVEKLAMKFL